MFLQYLERNVEEAKKNEKDCWERALEEVNLQIVLLKTDENINKQNWAIIIEAAAQGGDAMQLMASLENAKLEGIDVIGTAFSLVQEL